MKSGFRSVSIFSNSASLGCRGKAAGEDLQDFRAQVRKLRVRSFIFVSSIPCAAGMELVLVWT